MGFDVNAPLLTGLAEETRAGKPMFALPEDNIEVKVSEVFDRLDGAVAGEPWLHGLTARAGDLSGRQFIRSALPGNPVRYVRGDQWTCWAVHDERAVRAGDRRSQRGSRRAAGGVLVGRQMEVLVLDPADGDGGEGYVCRGCGVQRRIADPIRPIRQAKRRGAAAGAGVGGRDRAAVDEHGILI
ncbi:MAG: hypothetical protein R3B49_07030 [Phycisphaerales bacterium]